MSDMWVSMVPCKMLEVAGASFQLITRDLMIAPVVVVSSWVVTYGGNSKLWSGSPV